MLEYNSAGSLTKVLVRGSGYGGGIGSVIYTEDGAETNRRLFLYNAPGSTSALTDDAMAVSSTSSFDGWGSEVATTGTTTNDRKFCTKERAASIGLDYFGFRYYDADLGRFSTRDPAGYPDGLNNYLYCNNDPVNKIDPLGLGALDLFYTGKWNATQTEYDAAVGEVAGHMMGGMNSKMANRGIESANAMVKTSVGALQAAVGTKISVVSGGTLAPLGGAAMALDGISRAQGGITDYINVFKDSGNKIASGDVVETGFKQMFGNKHGGTVRNAASIVLSMGTSALVAEQAAQQSLKQISKVKR